MSLEFEATYENGILKPSQALPLQEGQKVSVTIKPTGSAAGQFAGSLTWTRDPDKLQRYLNAPDESSGRESATARANGAASRELPVADFMEAVEYGWTEAGYEVRQALNKYCEDTYADY
jgi:predicted DNA-binding antitoxin AbrB/MazE fold protein